MKRLYPLLIVSVLLMSCSKKEPLPEDVWQEGGIELAPYQDGYKISGICCTYITFPQVNLRSDRTFVVNGIYSTFTGAGFANFPSVLTGQLSADGTSLTITYSYGYSLNRHVFKPGRPTTICECACN